MNMTKRITIFGAAFVLIQFLGGSALAEKIDECNTDTCINYFEQYRKAAKRGHSLAMLTLGQFYHHGYGTPKNEKMALKFFKKAARAGYTSAQFKAGYIYMTSKDLQDLDKAQDYLEKAAKYEYDGADFLLGMMYLDEKYGVQDLAKADNHFANAYQRKHEQLPNVVKFINAKYESPDKAFPELYSLLNQKPLVTNENGELAWYDDGVEVITITSPPLQTTFNRQLVTFRKAIKSTGTRFKGKTCVERLTCLQRAEIADATDFRHLFLDGFSGNAYAQ
ncbi:sel1 repeat family protein [Thalassotalea euphylliae]|uniref:Sel1 repeat family protein n=2 Tax=Thalassotalea euphylliae TaxID=1655234 RepID=A0A3E0UG32_9GAMM|nr:sel1 repeat family protein [Thalassotalea euphylliae]